MTDCVLGERSGEHPAISKPAMAQVMPGGQRNTYREQPGMNGTAREEPPLIRIIQTETDESLHADTLLTNGPGQEGTSHVSPS